MTRLSTFIYKHGDERSKARAMLCCIFFEGIHDDFYRVSITTCLYCQPVCGFWYATAYEASVCLSVP